MISSFLMFLLFLLMLKIAMADVRMIRSSGRKKPKVKRKML